MSDTMPGADELRMQRILRQRGVGPDALPPPPVHPPMPAVPPKPAARPRDWLDDILDEAPAEAPAQADKPEEQVKRPWWKAKPASEPAVGPADESEEDDEEGEEGEEGEETPKPPSWDPVAIADLIVKAQQKRPLGKRLHATATNAVQAKAQFGQLLYTTTGVWAAWRIGFTPWLLRFTSDAPVGVPIGVLFLGWLVNRRLDGTPMVFAWCGRAVYTATVINLVLHP